VDHNADGVHNPVHFIPPMDLLYRINIITVR
jgi:hypothetical protein